MKLQKALAKAKSQRRQQPEPAFHQPGDAAQRQDNWRPPVYCRSKTVSVSRQTLAAHRCVCALAEAPELDAYKILRTQVQQLTRQRGWRTIMVTSPSGGEGASLTVVNLAITMAKEFQQTVLLVDADLRQQRVHRILGYPSQVGLVDHLLDELPLAELITWPGIEKLTVISGDRTIQESTELLGSPKMQALVTEMKKRYDDRYVLFDAPPLLRGADALAFAPFVDCVLMAIASGESSLAEARKAVELLPQEKMLGFVLNRHSPL